ncbi:MAG TPA: hypothetical protein VII52_02960 [Gemmatimonadaceae bacterium]
MTTAAKLLPAHRAALPPNVIVTIAAVAITGSYAAIVVTPALFPCTAAIIALLVRAGATANPRPEASDDFAEFPPAARAAVLGTMRELGEGNARRLLLGVAVQARPIFANRSTLLDQQAESATRDNAASLVEACCSTALELARLDSASAGAAASGADNETATSVAAVRQQMADRLANAAAALTSLYVAGLEHGSEASNRVSELVDDINADASARRAAGAGMAEVFGDSK